jgi:tRNA(Ile)-lysidine synthase
LFEILKQFGFHFKTVQLIFAQLDCQSGKIFYNAHYRIIKDRTSLIIDELKENELVEREFNVLEELLNYFPESCIEPYNTDALFEKSGHFAYFDADSLKFPLILRNWKNGDKIRPFGMKGQKKLSDFFNDNKLNLKQKENILVLCHDQEVLWILGYRSSKTFAVTSKTKYRVCLKNNL